MINISNKINLEGFYCPCDTVYFNDWAKYFLYSVKKYAPWAHVHFHIFDGTKLDKELCESNNFSFSSEPTPIEFSKSIETKKDFWVNMRFIRIPEIYNDSTKFMSIDGDSLLVKPLSKEQFIEDHKESWVTTAGKREQLSLGSAVGFSDDNARHILAERLKSYRYTDEFKWCLDQKVMDEMISSGSLKPRDIIYSDFKMNDNSFIWTGKGPRKNKIKYQSKIKEILGEINE